jgi:hypothetical protein
MLFFLPVTFLQAQEQGYFLDTSGDEPRFIQRLTWTGDEYAQRYEIIIEKEENGRYREVRRESTTALSMEVSLSSGKYRFLVVPYDFLNQSGERSPWMYIEVLPAFYPELDDVLPEFSLSDTDLQSRNRVYEMQISGKNLVPGAEIFLRGPNGEHIVPLEIQTSEDGDHVQLRFEKKLLTPGDYELVVINPGGLSTSKSEVPFVPPANQRAAHVFLSAGWMPPVTAYDDGNRFFGEVWSPSGAVIRFGIADANPGIINLGAELTESWSTYDASGGVHFFDTTVNFLMQKISPDEKAIVTLRLGVGYVLPLNDDIEFSMDFLHSNIGISFMGFIGESIYMELGIDCANWFTGHISGNLRPWIGIGLRL